MPSVGQLAWLVVAISGRFWTEDEAWLPQEVSADEHEQRGTDGDRKSSGERSE